MLHSSFMMDRGMKHNQLWVLTLLFKMHDNIVLLRHKLYFDWRKTCVTEQSFVRSLCNECASRSKNRF